MRSNLKLSSLSLVKAHLRRFYSASDGVGTVVAVFCMVVILMVAGVGLDYALAVRTQARLQAVADASALGAAMRLPHPTDALNEAMAVALLNGNNAREGAMVRPVDVEIGYWDAAARSFTITQGRPNAVRVTSRRSTASGNALRTLLVRLVGVNTYDVSARSIALRDLRVRCSGGGYFSARRTTVNNRNHFFNGFCLHGEQGVTLRNSSLFEPGTTISMPDLRTFIMDNGNVGARDALLEYSHTFVYLDTIIPTIAALRSGDIRDAGLPTSITHGPVRLSQITSSTVLQRGTLYIVSGPVNFGSNRDLNDIAIVASGDININSNTRTNGLILATDANINIGSNNRIGRISQDFCATGIYATFLLARGNITYNSNNEVRDVLMAARGNISMGSNNLATDGIMAEALGPIDIGNSDRAAVCRGGLHANVRTMEPVGSGGSSLVH
jgi:Flp pilus assembly protein TadG